MHAPGRLIAHGRATDIYDIGGGRVVRRYQRSPGEGTLEREARVMRYLRDRGAPVPEVFDVSGDDLVMELVGGRTMVDLLTRRPWTGHPVGTRLGHLHATLHAIPLTEELGLERVGDGNSILHRDFHPGNVMVDGPDAMVIDWTNVAVGSPGVDIATSWALIATGEVDDVPRPVRPLVNYVRRSMLAAYLDVVGREIAVPWIRTACAYRIDDQNCRPTERARLEAFAALQQ